MKKELTDRKLNQKALVAIRKAIVASQVGPVRDAIALELITEALAYSDDYKNILDLVRYYISKDEEKSL